MPNRNEVMVLRGTMAEKSRGMVRIMEVLDVKDDRVMRDGYFFTRHEISLWGVRGRSAVISNSTVNLVEPFHPWGSSIPIGRGMLILVHGAPDPCKQDT